MAYTSQTKALSDAHVMSMLVYNDGKTSEGQIVCSCGLRFKGRGFEEIARTHASTIRALEAQKTKACAACAPSK